MTDNILTRAAAVIVPLVIAIVFHEVAHGWAARALGDPTAEEQRRLSLNPLRHVDPVGTLLLPVSLAIAHAPVFGWAKPVPVDASRLRDPRTGMMLVALAGPATNLLLALLGAVLLGLAARAGAGDGFVAVNLLNFVGINVFLALFNLLPIPPFDGGHVAVGLLPRSLAAKYTQLGRFGMVVLLFLLVVLPMLVPGASVVSRVVGPPAEWLADHILTVANAIA